MITTKKQIEIKHSFLLNMFTICTPKKIYTSSRAEYFCTTSSPRVNIHSPGNTEGSPGNASEFWRITKNFTIRKGKEQWKKVNDKKILPINDYQSNN